MNIGIFGGTFDPPHIAHLALAEEALYQFGLHRLLWVLSPNPPHKLSNQISPIDHRIDLVQAAIMENPAFELSRVDIDRPPPHYAVDTVRLIASQYPETKLIYIMGGDSLHDLPTWYRPRQFLEAVHALGVMRRPGDHIDFHALEEHIPGISPKLQFVYGPLLDISASDIRARVALGKPFRYFLTQQVYETIQARQLYRMNTGAA